MAPEWKGACRYGWLDCFIVGKLVLSPLVLWATAALYTVEVLRADVSKDPFSVAAIFTGAIVSWACFVFGVTCLGREAGASVLMLVPFYVAVWYTLRTALLMRAGHCGFLTYLVGTTITIPFWVGSWLWSQNIFASLPDTQPQGCFVVTAAGRGHRRLVGPFVEIERGGKRRRANRQLITLWEFEKFLARKISAEPSGISAVLQPGRAARGRAHPFAVGGGRGIHRTQAGGTRCAAHQPEDKDMNRDTMIERIWKPIRPIH